MTQQDLATASHVSLATVQKLEETVGRPTLQWRKLDAILLALGVTQDGVFAEAELVQVSIPLATPVYQALAKKAASAGQSLEDLAAGVLQRSAMRVATH